MYRTETKMSATVAFKSLTPVYIPIRRNGKTPRISRWQTHKTTPELSSWYWQGNRAIVAGKRSNITVVDIDVKDGGLTAWQELIAEHGEPSTVKQLTPSGGLHYIFQYTPISTTTKVGGVGIDIRNDRSYFLTAPSKIDGKPYVMVGEDVEEMPAWLFEWLNDAPKQGGHKIDIAHP